jgi:signal transduction histidine kinase
VNPDGIEPGRLCAVLGHELRNPLAGAVTSLAVVDAMTDPADPRAAFLRRATTELQRLSRLLTAYLSWGAHTRPDLARTDVHRLAAGIAARHPQVRLAPMAGPAEVDADHDLLERAVENLVENAEAAGARTVELRVATGHGEVLIEIVDDGPGVTAEMAGRLFEPFVSGRGSSGLGLALARDVLESHGGRLEHLPSARGAVFRATLPVPSTPEPACAR